MYQTECTLPAYLFNALKTTNSYNVVVGSNLLNNNLAGGLFLTCSMTDFKFFEIRKSNPPQPSIKFRMFDLYKTTYLIEFLMVFKTGKSLSIQLNPFHYNVKLFFSTLLVNNLIAFHFYNKQSSLLVSTYKKLEGDEIEWINRNLIIINSLTQNSNYNNLASYFISQAQNKTKTFSYNNSLTIEQSFIDFTNDVVKF